MTTWNDDKGFGFITPAAGGDAGARGQKVFVHISAFERGTERPASGDTVTYSISTDSHGRLRAVGVTGPARLPRRAALSEVLAAVALVVVFGLLLCLRLTWGLTVWVVVEYAVASILCFIAYAADKSAARSGRRRTRESTLLLLGLIGGWPGAILAQQQLRHKNAKPSFQRAFWVTVVLNLVALVGFAVLTHG